MKTKILGLFGLLVVAGAFNAVYAGTGCLNTGTSCTTTTQVEVEILPGDICIGSTGSFDFGNYTASSSSQTVNGTFTDPFYVDDLRGSNTGYYTTVQLSGDLVGPGGATISGSNVYMQTTAIGNPGITTLAGSPNTLVVIDAGMGSYQSLDVARQLIKRPAGANSGVVGMYGTYPLMQLVIPPYQAVGTYTATLVYTLYEN
ncbi:MAG TPA: hypothetical protein PLW93_03900 [Candidatus Absconditabacterales bacterium]|nr:hypothetical protein [Candidatus Absconditabacterales bacterium]HNG97389.1 hypothetical protein [Candidatus Absconditabacterales bacterium]